MQVFPIATPRTVTWVGGLVGVIVGGAILAVLAFAVPMGLMAMFVLLFDGMFSTFAAVALAIAVAVGAGATIGKMIQKRARQRRKATDHPHVAVGADGIAIRADTSHRFHPWASVAGVRREGGRHVVIDLVQGPPEKVLVRDLAALERAVVEGQRRYETSHRSVRLRVLEPEGELDGDWVQRAKGARLEPAYRVESPSEDSLLEVLEDVAQTPAQRLGAALALSGAPSALERRVRLAIQDTADPELSRALEEAAAGELQPTTLRRWAKR